MNLDMSDVAFLIVAIAAAVVAWIVLGQFGVVAQIAGAIVAFVIVGRAVS